MQTRFGLELLVLVKASRQPVTFWAKECGLERTHFSKIAYSRRAVSAKAAGKIIAAFPPIARPLLLAAFLADEMNELRAGLNNMPSSVSFDLPVASATATEDVLKELTTVAGRGPSAMTALGTVITEFRKTIP